MIIRNIQKGINLISSNEELKSAFEITGYTGISNSLNLLLGKAKGLKVGKSFNGEVLNNVGLDTKLLNELSNNGVKFSASKMLRIAKNSEGKIVFLEEGNETKGLTHILQRHEQDFLKKGITKEQIPDAIITAILKGRIIKYVREQGIYEFTFNGKVNKIALIIGDNGFIVTYYPQ